MPAYTTITLDPVTSIKRTLEIQGRVLMGLSHPMATAIPRTALSLTTITMVLATSTDFMLAVRAFACPPEDHETSATSIPVLHTGTPIAVSAIRIKSTLDRRPIVQAPALGYLTITVTTLYAHISPIAISAINIGGTSVPSPTRVQVSGLLVATVTTLLVQNTNTPVLASLLGCELTGGIEPPC